MSKLSQETIDKIKEEAETYSGTQVWVNKNSSPEHLFHEFISATSFERGATEWAGRAQPVIDISQEIVMLFDPTRRHVLVPADVILRLSNALAKHKEVEPAPAKPIEYMPVHPEDSRKPYCPRQVPMHLLDEARAIENHSQSLNRLKERGGLSVIEILAIVGDKPWNYYGNLKWEEALKMLNDILNKEAGNG